VTSLEIETHFWAKRSAVVTGGQGFIGRCLGDALRRRGVDVGTPSRRRSADATDIVLEASRDSQAVPAPIVFGRLHLAGKATGTPGRLTHENVDLIAFYAPHFAPPTDFPPVIAGACRAV
jgi:nucleoside-diphosphate-sugar epimerase